MNVPFRIFLLQNSVEVLLFVVDGAVASNRLQKLNLGLGAASSDDVAARRFGQLYRELTGSTSSSSDLKAILRSLI